MNKTKLNPNLAKIDEKMKEKKKLISIFEEKVKSQLQNLRIIQKRNSKKLGTIQTQQKKIQNPSKIEKSFCNQQKDESPTQQDIFSISSKPHWDFHKFRDLISLNICNPNKYYPPSCSGFDIAYCKIDNAIYVYGGISCETALSQGIKTFFYKYSKEKWTEVKPQSIYCPIPRYGHTLTFFQRDLILFGGVSEYKQKLKDRCFYSDISLYNTLKNQWKILETSDNFAKTRKSHASCISGKHFFVYGGINEIQEVITDLSWINIEQRKPRWKSMTLEARFNHKMISIEMKGKQFLAVFGGRNETSEIINCLSIIPLFQVEGEIVLKDPIKVSHQMTARQMPLMQKFHQGFLILGGNNQDNQVVSDSWYYHAQKQFLEKLELDLDFKELRGCQGISVGPDKIYIMGCNSKKYKALQIEIQK